MGDKPGRTLSQASAIGSSLRTPVPWRMCPPAALRREALTDRLGAALGDDGVIVIRLRTIFLRPGKRRSTTSSSSVKKPSL